MKFESRLFRSTVLLKGLDGLLEVAGGLLLLIVSPASLNRLVITLTQHELSQDPRDFIANHLLASSHLMNGGRYFAVMYLLLHGLVKIGLILAMLKQNLWAYPASLVFLLLFMLYQIYRIGLTHSAGLVLLTVFDGLIFSLAWREYRRLTIIAI